MGEREKGYWRNRKREAVEPKSSFPPLPFPQDAALSIKNIAYLHVYCALSPQAIVSRFSKTLTLADVHLGLAHYYLNRETIDAEIKRELAFNRRDTLGDASMSLPRLGLASLVSTLKE